MQVIPGYISTIRDSSIITLDGWGTITTQYGTFQVLRTLERHWIKEYLNGQLTADKRSVSYAWFDQRGITILSYTNPSDSVNFTTASIIEAELAPASAEQINNVIPKNFQLDQNYPNPFNPSTKIRYSIPEASFASIKVYDMLGKELAILVNEEQSAGNYEVDFNAAGLSSGIYFYQLQAGNFVEMRKMILLR
ncbi:MAG: T9SS type A sorting domain-containing protein [Ignavibacteriaceae bacterium]|nr:T9SS type A sorting domain-containing protein [Ignavibacteriaceae bacterium]